MIASTNIVLLFTLNMCDDARVFFNLKFCEPSCQIVFLAACLHDEMMFVSFRTTTFFLRLNFSSIISAFERLKN